MRTEKEMMRLILGIAENDERILAAFISGSRMDQNAPKDIFQDYDIVYVVRETASFIQDKSLITAFGSLLLLQEPERLDFERGLNAQLDLCYGYLMLFEDGNRIDLHIVTEEGLKKGYMVESLMKPLLDKTGVLASYNKEPSNADYIIQKPSYADYRACCNDFYWCLQNVAKGLWRNEIPYAQEMFQYIINGRVKVMLNWWIGKEQNFSVSPGKMGKFYKRYLPESYYNLFLKLYCDGDPAHIWESVFIAIELFSGVAFDVGKSLEYPYEKDEEKNMIKYLNVVRSLPKDAESIF